MTQKFDLSVLTSPQYTVTLPSSGKEVRLRAMLAREHKALLIANESDEKVDAIEQCLKNCIMSDDLKLEDLTVADSEFLFLQIYMNSNAVTEIEAVYNCLAPVANEDADLTEEEEEFFKKSADEMFAEIVNQTDEEALEKVLTPDKSKVCGHEIKTKIDLTKATVMEYKGDDTIKVNSNVTIKLKHPTIRVYEDNDPNDPLGLYNIACEAIHEVHVGDTVYTQEELKQQNALVDILGELDTNSYKKIQKFVDDVPRLQTFIDVICPACGNHEKVQLRGIEDFFV